MASTRYLDIDPDEDLENESPVHGVHDAEDLTALEACTRAKAACPRLATWDLNLALAAAGRAVKRLEKRGELAPLTREEAFAVHVYTQDSWFYKEVNRRLRLRERQSLKPLLPLSQAVSHRPPPARPRGRYRIPGGQPRSRRQVRCRRRRRLVGV